MSSYKNKILNYKPTKNPSLWDKVEDKVISLNKEVSSKSKFSLGYFLGALLSLFGIALISMWMINDSNFVQNSELKSSLENHITVNANNLDYAENNMNDEVTTQKSKIVKDLQTDIKLGEGIPSENPLDRDFRSMEATGMVSSSSANTNKSKSSQIRSRKDINVLNVADKGIHMSKTENIYEVINQPKNKQALILENENESPHGIVDTKENDDKIEISEVSNLLINDILTIPHLETIAWEQVFSKYDNKDKLSPCNPMVVKDRNVQLGASFGFGTHLYPGYFTTISLDYRLNKLVRAGVKINHQRYTDAAKFITSPEAVNGKRTTNLLANLSLILLDNVKFSFGVDFSPGIELVTENYRTQNGDQFYATSRQYHGFNYMIGAHLEYRISRRWKLGLESVVDVKGETTMHGLRCKYIL